MQYFNMPLRNQNSNKRTFGKVLNFCGSDNYIGAAYFSAASSLIVGAGYSALATESKIINSISILFPEAVYLTTQQGLSNINNFDVVLIGCGISLNRNSKKLIKQVLKNTSPDKPIIIDADGLNIMAKLNLRPKNDNLIITPHPLEASRLLNCELNQVLDNIEESAKILSKKYNCVTVLKTHRTVICDKNLNIHINNNGNSALAKAGSGDVLAGIISGLVAQKMELFDAAKLGVYLHSKTGEIASRDLTEYSVLARDLLKYLPQAIRELLE